MINIFRKNQQFFLILITLLVIIAFVWLYNDTQFERLGTDKVAEIYGRTLTQSDVTRDVRKFDLARRLQLWDFLNDLASPANNEQQAFDNFIVNTIVLRHEAKQLGIEVTDEEIVEAIKEIQAFQTNGAFDPQKYATFVEQSLTPFGFTRTHVEDLIADQVRLRDIRSLINSTVALSSSELRSAYELRYQPIEALIVRLDEDQLLRDVKLSDADIKTAYEQRKDQLKTEEQRRIRFVTFALPEPPKTEGKDSTPQPTPDIQQLQKLADQASEFTQAVLEHGTSFEEAARKFKVTPRETNLFTQSKPDSQVANVPAATEAAFRLSKEDPNSDVIQAENVFYVLHLQEVVPSRPLTFDEARPQLAAQLSKERAQEQMKQKAAEIRTKLSEAIKAGKSFADAVKQAGVQVEKLPLFKLGEPDPDNKVSPEIAQTTVELSEREISDFVPTEKGGALVYLEKRHPIDTAKFNEQKATFADALLRGRRELAFREWMRMQRDAAKIQTYGAT
jgi:peptidyl-prolyl cis-trans isomerase D